LPAAELTDTCIDLKSIFNKHNKHLSEQLICTPSFDGQFDILSSYLWQQIQVNNANTDETTHYALGQIIQANGNIELKELLKEINMTERTFERKFNHHVGISPKLFARICRFQTSLQQLKSSNYNKLSDIAFDNGYADQSHFIRAFKEFAGYSPNQLSKQKNTDAENLLEWKAD
jgi:AraC-like DNA-binding protein